MKNNKKYDSPWVESVLIESEDIISTSPESGGGDLDQDIGEWDDEM